jgi:Flp pilus assembly protein TadD
MEGVFLLLVFAFYLALRLLFWLLPDQRRKDRAALQSTLQLLAMRNYAEALPVLNTFLAHKPTSVEGLLARAKCYLETEEYLLALADCARATNKENHLPQAYLMKGKALLELDQLHEAFTEFDKAAWYDRANPEPYTWRGLTHRRMGHDAQADADFMLAASLGDENAMFYLRKPAHLGIWR